MVKLRQNLRRVLAYSLVLLIGAMFYMKTTHMSVHNTGSALRLAERYFASRVEQLNQTTNTSQLHSSTTNTSSNAAPDKSKVEAAKELSPAKQNSSGVPVKGKTAAIAKTRSQLSRAQQNLINQQRQQQSKRNTISFQPVNIMRAKVYNSSDLDMSKYTDRQELIPRRIHQIWETTKVPGIYKDWIKSVVNLHPNWEYWFWTFEDMDYFVKTRFPDFYSLYVSYRVPILKANLARLLIMYDIGGFYLDIDMEALKPLDVWTRIASTVLVHENYEHTFFLYKNQVTNVMNTVIASAPKHPIYRLMNVEELQHTYNTLNSSVRINGVFYFDSLVQRYIKMNNISKWNENITVVHPTYWLTTYDGAWKKHVQTSCKIHARHAYDVKFNPEADEMITDMCAEHELNGYVVASNSGNNFLKHYWIHANTWKSSKKLQNVINIAEIVGARFTNVTQKLMQHFSGT